MDTKSLGFIGGGRVTRIFLKGFMNKNIEFPSITVCDTNSETLQKLESMFPGIKTSGSPLDPAKAEVIFIALHPPVIAETLAVLKSSINKNALIISLAPKFSIEKLSEILGTNRILRMIPNASSIINKGYNPVCFSNEIGSFEKESTLELLQSLGDTFETEESKLEAYAISSAMLPTYFWFQWLEMENIAQKMGLSSQESQETIHESLKVSLQLLYNSGLRPEEVMDLIPVKPIAEEEEGIKEIYNVKLLALFEKIKPSIEAVDQSMV